MGTKIAIVNVKDYNSIQEAIVSAIKMVEDSFSFKLSECKNILLKPNLLRATKDACTQPAFVEGALAYLKEKKVPRENINIGDSPGQIKTFATKIAQKVGIYDIVEREGINFIDFEREIPIEVQIEGALRFKNCYISKPVVDCDLLINLPKLKTHGEATITGAIKNYWGIIPGGLKAKTHLLGKTPDQFGEVLADNYAWVVKNKPNRLIIYDLHTIMQGAMGPVSGKMKNWNLVLVGTDELALDTIALEIGKFKGLDYVPHLKSAYERGLGIGDLKDIEIVGMSLEEAKRITPKFKVPGKRMTKLAASITGGIVYRVTKRVPKLQKKKCIQCGQCSEICPAEAIEFRSKDYPKFKTEVCISCLCCMEMCPQQAIKAKRRGFFGLFHKF
jgi:uncharacterized protein (DUF362 family)/NAD-dependent dihydropyrimidine dehydrogenase PreA subunit